MPLSNEPQKVEIIAVNQFPQVIVLNDIKPRALSDVVFKSYKLYLQQRSSCLCYTVYNDTIFISLTAVHEREDVF